MSLLERLAARIRAEGPIATDDYMMACLHDPQAGYYATRPALGPEGDFITAPLISQMFGELIGLWLAEAWDRLGRPSPVRLVEVGPGDGTLMSDVLRAARLAPEFLQAADVWLVETSAPLRRRQQERLGAVARWAERLDQAPTGAPLLLIANELLDCLPVRQAVRTVDGWRERRVGLTAAGALAYVAGEPVQPPPLAAAPGQVFERAPAQEGFAAQLAGRLVRDGGAALLIDYGPGELGLGDTLQALSRHRKVDPLAAPGEADLTVHALFPAVRAAAEAQGAQTALLTQGEFLARLGIDVRAASLARARPDKAGELARQLERLSAPDQMGELFKVLCIHAAGFIPPAF